MTRPTRARVLLLALVPALAVVVIVAALVVRGRVEGRVAERLSCRFDGEADVSVSAWRSLTGLATGALGDVRVRIEDAVAGADVDLVLRDVRRAGDGVDVGSADARIAVPLDGLELPLTAEDGHLVVRREVLGGAIEVVLVPHLDGTRVTLEVASMRYGERELTGRFAEQLAGRLPEVDLADRLPDGMTPTGLEVTDDALVVEATLDAGAGLGAGGC